MERRCQYGGRQTYGAPLRPAQTPATYYRPRSLRSPTPPPTPPSLTLSSSPSLFLSLLTVTPFQSLGWGPPTWGQYPKSLCHVYLFLPTEMLTIHVPLVLTVGSVQCISLPNPIHFLFFSFLSCSSLLDPSAASVPPGSFQGGSPALPDPANRTAAEAWCKVWQRVTMRGDASIKVWQHVTMLGDASIKVWQHLTMRGIAIYQGMTAFSHARR